jgi:hypothetical protein
MQDPIAPPNQSEDVASAIEELLLDNDGISRIEDRLGGFNIFEAIGHTRAEMRHSDFLAFLLDPNRDHGLGSDFLSRFVIEVVKAIPSQERPISVSEIALMDFERCLVLREHHSIDVMCIDEANRFLLAIENKIGSGEHSDQLQRYRAFLETHHSAHRRVLAYLTPDADTPSDDFWTPISYAVIASILESLGKKYAGGLGRSVLIALNHYAQMLRRNIVTDTELVKIARAVYLKHRTALDFIFEQRLDPQLEMSESICSILKEDGRIKLTRSTKSYINFVPLEWENIDAFKQTSEKLWTRTGHTLLFEVTNERDRIRLCLIVGPAEDDARVAIVEFAKSSPLLRAPAKLTSKWTTIYSKTLIDRPTFAKSSLEEIREAFVSKFRKFMDGDFPKIVSRLSANFSN